MRSAAIAVPAAHGRAHDFIALGKPRLNFLVVASSLAGYAMAGGSTRDVPPPDGRLQPRESLVFATLASLAGLALLGAGANLLSAAVALTTLVTYAAIYPPMKRRSSFATVVGAIPGALPPVLGRAAARGSLPAEAGLLFAIVFPWPVPHFL